MVHWLRLATIMLLAGASNTQASFHLMQIQKAIGGVGDNTSVQAVQLRMRAGGQNLVNTRTVKVYDSTGSNPVTLVTFNKNVLGNSAGSTILIATTDFQNMTGLSADFTMTNAIPDSYLPAGRLTFESGNSVYWSLAWGGVNYTGSHTGLTTNDPDGDFGPAFDGPLPSTAASALEFSGAASDLSTTNAADYAVPDGDAEFTNNAGESVTVSVDDLVFFDGFESLPL